MYYKCTRAEQREDGRYHYEFEGPTFLKPPLPTPKLTILHPVEMPVQVGTLYELGLFPMQLTRAEKPVEVPAGESTAPAGAELPMVELRMTGTVEPPPAAQEG